MTRKFLKLQRYQPRVLVLVRTLQRTFVSAITATFDRIYEIFGLI